MLVNDISRSHHINSETEFILADARMIILSFLVVFASILFLILVDKKMLQHLAKLM